MGTSVVLGQELSVRGRKAIGWFSVYVVMLAFTSVAAVLGTWGYGVWTTSRASLALPIFALSALFLVAGVGVPALAGRERCLRHDEREWCTELRSDLSKALTDVDNPLRGLAELNFHQMRVFTTEAIRQARRAAYACFAAAWVSLVVLVLGAAGAMIAEGVDARISATVLAAIGACLSTFITHVFVKSYLVAARQMSYYYGQPLVHCYLLNAERLANSFGSDSGGRQRWQLVQQVMSASLDAGRSAQKHLLQLQVDAGPHPAPESAVPTADGRESLMSLSHPLQRTVGWPGGHADGGQLTGTSAGPR